MVDNPVADHNREGEMQEINSSVLALATNVGKFLLQVLDDFQFIDLPLVRKDEIELDRAQEMLLQYVHN